MRIYHIAIKADWEQATRTGRYTISTHGRTLDQEGFIHAAREEQVPGVLARFYDGVTEDLVVLEIETDRLDVPWREDDVDGTTFPHIYGPLVTRAVVDIRPARPEQRRGAGAASRVPPPPQVPVFHGLAGVLGLSAVALFLAGALAHRQSGHSLHPEALLAAQFVLWSLTFTAAVAGLACWAMANAFVNDHRNLSTWSRSG